MGFWNTLKNQDYLENISDDTLVDIPNDAFDKNLVNTAISAVAKEAFDEALSKGYTIDEATAVADTAVAAFDESFYEALNTAISIAAKEAFDEAFNEALSESYTIDEATAAAEAAAEAAAAAATEAATEAAVKSAAEAAKAATAAAEAAEAAAQATQIEGNLKTGLFSISSDDKWLVYLFFAGLAVAVYFYFKYKIIKK
jgi:cobalamin biosynthesis Mg chelatase CobN